MKFYLWFGAGVVLFTACATTSQVPLPNATGDSQRPVAADSPNGFSGVDAGLHTLQIVGCNADSVAAGSPAANMIDGDPTTSWTSGGHRNTRAWAMLQLAGPATLSSIRIKTQPGGAGAYYDIQVSDDGDVWYTALSQQHNSDFSIETKAFPPGTQGTYVRVLWHNSPTVPQENFKIYDWTVQGALAAIANTQSAPTGVPSLVIASPPNTVVPSRSPAAPGSIVYELDLAGVNDGALPKDWLNVADVGPAFPWLIGGSWGAITLPDGSRAIRQAAMDAPWYKDSPPLTFLRFNAPTFGLPHNGLPDRYHLDATLTVRNCDPKDPYAPIGDSGIQVYFIDPTHYVEVLYRPNNFEIWQCNGGQPFAFSGWTLIGRFSHQAATGQVLDISATVDTVLHTLTVLLPNAPSATVFKVPMLSNQPHWATLRTSNAIIDFANIRMTRL